MTQPTTQLVLPTAEGEIVLDLTQAYRTEMRLRDVASVNRHKAPELMSAFNRAFLNVAQHLLYTKKTLLEHKRALNKRRAHIILSEVPEKLKAMGMRVGANGSKEILEAIITSDAEFQQAQQRVDQTEAIHEYLKEKKMAFAMAFSSVKAIFNEKAYDYSGTPLNGTIADEAVAGQTVDEDGAVVETIVSPATAQVDPPKSVRSLFGTARIG